MYNNYQWAIEKMLLNNNRPLTQVRSSDVSWSDTRRTLRKDHRWESGSLLEREEKEKLFNEHIEALTKKKREHFRQLLDETSAVRAVYAQTSGLCQYIV